MAISLIDTHCHLSFFDQKKQKEIIENATRHHIIKIITVGTSIESSEKSIQLAKQEKILYASAGIHPSEIQPSKTFNFIKNTSQLTKLAANKEVIAIGECGLDYSRIKNDDFETRKKQQELFQIHLFIAKKFNLPIIIHSRDTFDDTIKILDKNNFPFSKVVFHCWTYDLEKAQKMIARGAFLSFTGIVTYPNAKKIQETVSKIPLDHFFLETDSPFLSPQSKRKKQNQPKFLIETVEKIAALRQTSPKQIGDITSKNAINFFNLD